MSQNKTHVKTTSGKLLLFFSDIAIFSAINYFSPLRRWPSIHSRWWFRNFPLWVGAQTDICPLLTGPQGQTKVQFHPRSPLWELSSWLGLFTERGRPQRSGITRTSFCVKDKPLSFPVCTLRLLDGVSLGKNYIYRVRRCRREGQNTLSSTAMREWQKSTGLSWASLWK